MPPRLAALPCTTLFRSRRHDTDDGEILAVDAHSPADRGWIGGETLAPEGVAQDDHPVMSGAVVLGRDETSQGRRHAQGGEKIRSEEHTSELQSPCNLVCRLASPPFPARRSSDLGGMTPMTVRFSPSTRIVRPIAAGSAAKRWRQKASLRTITRSCPGRSSSVVMKRPKAGATPKAAKKSDRKSTRLNSSHLVISYAASPRRPSLHDALPISAA